jgi:branched-chain amino acid transport system substrate-binding protein
MLVERMDQGAQDMNAQLVKFKGSGADTLFVTTAVEQLSLVLKQPPRRARRTSIC